MNYGIEEAEEISTGLLIGEQATASTLRALADCLQSLAAMDDTVGSIVSAWSRITTEDGSIDYDAAAASAAEVQANYRRAFDAFDETGSRIAFAVQKYRAQQSYARRARDAGRGSAYNQRYAELGEGNFSTMLNKRIELLRRLKVRVRVLQHLEDTGLDLLRENDYPEFFIVFMQPLRDLTQSVRGLYDEVVRGALVSHQVMFQSCHLAGEELSDEEMEAYSKSVLVDTPSNGDES